MSRRTSRAAAAAAQSVFKTLPLGREVARVELDASDGEKVCARGSVVCGGGRGGGHACASVRG